MNGSVRSLLEGVIDYAGMFPPAHLKLEAALDEYLALKAGPQAWMVRHFACPVGKLMDLAGLLEAGSSGTATIAVMGSGGEGQAAWEYGLEHDTRRLEGFVAEAGDAAELATYEVKLPKGHHVDECIDDLEALQSLDVYLELPLDETIEEALPSLAEASWINAKARTGGESVPPAAQLAEFLQGSVQLEVPFKLTAGLHHPLARVGSGSRMEMHGFLNVLMATALCDKFDLSRREMEQVLEVTDASAFAFSDERVVWNGMELEQEDLEACRELFHAFGSCSVAEPVTDLKAIGLFGAGR